MDDDFFMCSTWHSVDMNEGFVFMTGWFSCALKKGGNQEDAKRES